MSMQSQVSSHETGELAAADAIHAVMRFLRVLRYRKSYVITSLVVAGLLGAVYYFTATRIYQASASLLVTQTGSDWNTSPTADSSRDAFIPTYEKLFSSAVVLQGALQRLVGLPPSSRVDLVDVPREKWLDTLRNNLSARGVRRTNVIELSYRSKSPEAAEAVVNAIVESYLEFMDENHKTASVQLVTILDNERKETARELNQKQQELLNIKRNAGIVVRDGAEFVHPTVQRVIELNETLVEIQKERIQLAASLTAIRSALRNGGDLREHLIAVEPMVGRELIMTALGLNPQYTELAGQMERKLVEDRANLVTLRQHYGPTHHEILKLEQGIQNARQYLVEYQSKMNARLQGVHEDQLGPMLLSMVEEKLAKAWEQEKELTREYRHAEGQAVLLNDRMSEMQMVDNEVQRLRNLHDTLLDRIANIDLKQNRADIRVAIVSEPTASEDPVSPRLAVIGILCLLGGCGTGAGIVYVTDLLDDRFRSPDEMKEQTSVPILAMVRRLTTEAAHGSDALHVHVSPTSVETEAFRTLRTTLAFAGDEMQCVAVTSSEPGDGKTTVLANLGTSYAQAGKRTLLIDADLRRPGLSKLFQMRSSEGLSEMLRSEDDLASMCDERIRPSGVDQLDVLPCGPRPSDPAELLSSTRFSDLMAWAETRYDQVLVDCPPVMAATDAAIVGRVADGMLLVVQPEKNHRRLVLRAVEDLATMQVQLVGIVANRVGDDREGGYYGYGSGYGYGYGYGYGHGYGQDEEELSQEPDTGTQSGASLDSVVPRRAA